MAHSQVPSLDIIDHRCFVFKHVLIIKPAQDFPAVSCENKMEV